MRVEDGVGTRYGRLPQVPKIVETKFFEIKSSDFAVFVLLTLLPNLKGLSPTGSDIVVERGGAPQLILHIVPLHLFYMMYILGVICNVPVFIKT